MSFDADVRYSGVSIGYTMSQVLGSAFAPTIATALYTATESSNAIAAYLIAVSVISAVAACFLPGGWKAPVAGTDAALGEPRPLPANDWT